MSTPTATRPPDGSPPVAAGTPATARQGPAPDARPAHGSGHRSASLADLSICLAVAGLLPMLPLIGSLAATVCGALAHRSEDPRARARASVGLALGILGLLAPAAFLIIYCGLLGYPFPLHRYRPD